MRRIFLLFLFLLAAFFGYWLGQEPKSKEKKRAAIKEIPHPERDFPLTDEKEFAFVVYSYKNSSLCERTLKSIFEQEYERFRVIFFDDASQDGTFEKVQSFVLENKQDHRVILIQNRERIGPVACLYRAAATLQDREIALPLDVKDWLAHPRVLNRLNAVYQNPDVWVTVSSPLLYPSYETCEVSGFENIPFFSPISFYSALFKEIRLADLVEGGRFVTGRNAYLEPLLKMAKGQSRVLNEPLFIANMARISREAADKPFSSYSELAEFPCNSESQQMADIVLFSCDRPLQLFACLESIQRYLSGVECVYVLCRASDEKYRAGYQEVAEEFPDVQFVFQGKEFKKDFKPLFLKAVFESPSEYVVFGTDDQIVKDEADLSDCIEMMSKTKAYAFYLRLGSHITHSYQLNRSQAVPESIDLGKGIFAWSIKTGYCDWDFPHTLDMAIYRKSMLKTTFESLRYKTPNSLEFSWAKAVHPEHEIGLYFEHSKVVNIPLNVVGRTGNPHMNYLTAEELQVKFEQGLKINIDPLYRIENPSPHFEYYPDFVQR